MYPLSVVWGDDGDCMVPKMDGSREKIFSARASCAPVFIFSLQVLIWFWMMARGRGFGFDDEAEMPGIVGTRMPSDVSPMQTMISITTVNGFL